MIDNLVIGEPVEGLTLDDLGIGKEETTQTIDAQTARDMEWKLSVTDPFILFYRYWTSKESVLKASGTGIRDLLKCRIIRIIDDNHLVVDYRDQEWLIEHYYFDEHIASVVKNNFHVQWTNQARI